MTVTIGAPAPDFTLPTDNGGSISLSAQHGRIVVLYFYPKDDTPGCTTEACAFNDALPDFSALDAMIIGVSKDSPASHDRFKKKFGLNFALASDADGKVCEAYGAWGEKTNYGRKYFGIQRSTVLIDQQGVVRQIWPKVKVNGHALDVLAALRAL